MELQCKRGLILRDQLSSRKCLVMSENIHDEEGRGGGMVSWYRGHVGNWDEPMKREGDEDAVDLGMLGHERVGTSSNIVVQKVSGRGCLVVVKSGLLVTKSSQ